MPNTLTLDGRTAHAVDNVGDPGYGDHVLCVCGGEVRQSEQDGLLYCGPVLLTERKNGVSLRGGIM